MYWPIPDLIRGDQEMGSAISQVAGLIYIVCTSIVHAHWVCCKGHCLTQHILKGNMLELVISLMCILRKLRVGNLFQPGFFPSSSWKCWDAWLYSPFRNSRSAIIYKHALQWKYETCLQCAIFILHLHMFVMLLQLTNWYWECGANEDAYLHVCVHYAPRLQLGKKSRI